MISPLHVSPGNPGYLHSSAMEGGTGPRNLELAKQGTNPGSGATSGAESQDSASKVVRHDEVPPSASAPSEAFEDGVKRIEPEYAQVMPATNRESGIAALWRQRMVPVNNKMEQATQRVLDVQA